MAARRTFTALHHVLGILMLVATGSSNSQVVSPPISPPVAIAPVAPSQFPVLPGSSYTFEFKPSLVPSSGVVSISTTSPDITIEPLPNGPDGDVRRQVVVSEGAPSGNAVIHIETDQGSEELPLVIASPPPPPPESTEQGHPPHKAEPDDDDKKNPAKEADDPHHTSRLGGFLVTFGLGVLVGLAIAKMIHG